MWESPGDQTRTLDKSGTLKVRNSAISPKSNSPLISADHNLYVFFLDNKLWEGEEGGGRVACGGRDNQKLLMGNPHQTSMKMLPPFLPDVRLVS